jgi:DNA-binding transcriptional LysR family regulator
MMKTIDSTRVRRPTNGSPSRRRPLLFPYSRFDVRLLDAVDLGGDLGELSRRLGLRIGALERHLGRLDRAAGMPLTLRGSRTTRLTSAGARVLAAGQRFFSRVDLALLTTIYGHGDGAQEFPSVLSIATSNPMVEDLVEEIAARLGILLAVSHATPEQVVRQLDAYRVDAVHTWWLTDPRTSIDRVTRLHVVLDEPLCVWLPRGHRLAARDVVTLADLTTDCWVSEIGPGSEVVVVQVFRGAGLPVPTNLTVTSSSVARGMIRRDGVLSLEPLLSGTVSDSAVVNRPLAECPSRSTGLLVDPAMVPDVLAKDLASTLKRNYLRMVVEHHPEMVRNPWWSRWHREQMDREDMVSIARSGKQGSSQPVIEALDIEEFSLLRAVAEHGSINRAAAVLSISQPALTRRARRIEQRIGAPLMVRSARGTTLSGPAKQFLYHLTALETEFHAAVSGPLDRLSDPHRRYA